MGFCGCFGFGRKFKRTLSQILGSNDCPSEELLLDGDVGEDNEVSCGYDESSTQQSDDYEFQSRIKHFQEAIMFRVQNGLICREIPVKQTHTFFRSEDENGNKMINEYVHEYKIGSGSYGKVILYRSRNDEKHYAIKAFRKSYLMKLKVGPSETAMSDVLREVLIMKTLEHPNIVNLIEVIDDPNTDNFYMVLEYVEGKCVCEGSGPHGGLGEVKARSYLRDTISGLKYLHAHNVVHGDIKPDNLLVTGTGRVKIGDFSVSQVFQDDDDVLRRSPGTPVFTAPECCLELTYHGKAADTWALGVTLYCMVVGQYPFIGDTLHDTYDKIVNSPLDIPDGVDPQLRELLHGLLCKDPGKRMTLDAAAEHAWVIGAEGPIPQYLCWCKRSNVQTM